MPYGLDSGTVQIILAAKDATAAAFATVNARMKTLEVTAARVRMAVASVAKATLLIGAAGVVASVYASTKAFMSFEDALASVRKTTGMTKDEILSLGNALTGLSTTKLPMVRSELATVAAVAGQLGIQGKENILTFTESVAMMSVAFDMSAEDAATAMAKLGKIYDIPIEQTENLASAINVLGNTTAAKEREIIAFSMALGPVAEQLGFTETQTISLGATLVSMGMDASHAGTRLNRAFSMIGQNINELAEFMGVSAEQFTRSFDEMPMETFIDILKKLDAVGSGLAANTVASELFGEVGAKTIRTLLSSIDDLYTNLENSEKGFKENTAVADEFADKTDTLTAKWQLFKNEVVAAFGELGKRLAPTYGALLAAFKDAIPGLLDYVITLKNELAPAITNVKEMFESAKGIFKDLFGTDAEDEISAFAAMVNKLTDVMKRFFDILDKNPALVKFALAIGAVTVALAYAVPAVMGLYTSLHFLYMHPVILTLAAITAALVYLEVEFGLVSNTTAQFGRGLTELKARLEPVTTGLNALKEGLPEVATRFEVVTDAIGDAVAGLKQLYDMLPNVAKRALGLAKDVGELWQSFMIGGPLGMAVKQLYEWGENTEEAGHKSEKTAKQIGLTKDELQAFITEIETSTPKIQEYKDAVETTATALKTWGAAQRASQQAQLALSQPKADLAELNRLLSENIGLEQKLTAIVTESQTIYDEAAALEAAALEKVTEITQTLIDIEKARTQAREEAGTKIARIAQNEISAKEAIQRTNTSLLQSQRALISMLEDYDDLTRSLTGAELSVEGAEIAVEKAQRAYDQIQSGWAPIEIGFSFPGAGGAMDPFAQEDALLALRRAELDLTAAIDARADTQERVNALEGAEKIKDVIAAYKGLSAEEFETTFYVGGQLDIESLKESITDADAAAISERIKGLLPDIDLGTGIESILTAITSYEDDVLTLEQKLTGYTQDLLDVTEDLHEELESLYEDEIGWNEDLLDAKENLDTATGNLTNAELEWGEISKLYAGIVKTADNDRLTRAGVLYDAIKVNERDYNTLLATTGKTYNALETDVKNLQTVVNTAMTAEKTVQLEYNTELANTKTLLEHDMVAAWNTLTQHLESTPANATIALPDIEDLFTPFLVDIQKLADNNPIKIALDWSDSGKVIGDTVLEPGYGKPWPAEPEKSKVVPKEETTSESKERYAYDPQSQSYYTSERGEYYYDESGDLVSDTILESGAGLKKYTSIPEKSKVIPTEEVYGPGGDTIPTTPSPATPKWPEYGETKEDIPIVEEIGDPAAANAWDDVKFYFDKWYGEPFNSLDYGTYFPLYTKEKEEYDDTHGVEHGDWSQDKRPLAHSGGETLNEGLIEVERGEWIFPRDVVAQFKELLTLPSLAPAMQTVSNSINIHIDTINDKSDADYLITKVERTLNQRALI